ncbi:MAG TPA: hypothetical protein VKU38_17020 [Ktedonobacteraceae bacterium]|nr:hypothetical protein [Ktedonobacteraceae bacterium]
MVEAEDIPVRTDQRDVLMMLVVASDRKMLKLLDMALSTEFECDILAFASGKSAEETAKQVRLDLVVIDAHLLDSTALELADRLHAIKVVESVPMLLVNTPRAWGNISQRNHTLFLHAPFVLADFYSAVNTCLGRT